MTSVQSGPPDLAGLRLLVAEDDALIGMELEDQLEDAGCKIVGFATSLQQIIELASRDTADGAVLDINLGGEMVYRAAEILRARGIPFVFLTGYQDANLPVAFAGEKVCRKPLDFEELTKVLRTWRKLQQVSRAR